MAKQYEDKFEKEKYKHMSKEAQIESKLREAQQKKIEQLKKENPREVREFNVSIKLLIL